MQKLTKIRSRKKQIATPIYPFICKNPRHFIHSSGAHVPQDRGGVHHGWDRGARALWGHGRGRKRSGVSEDISGLRKKAASLHAVQAGCCSAFPKNIMIVFLCLLSNYIQHGEGKIYSHLFFSADHCFWNSSSFYIFNPYFDVYNLLIKKKLFFTFLDVVIMLYWIRIFYY